MRFRKKPVEVDAIQYTAETCLEIHKWMGVEHQQYGDTKPCGKDHIYIETLEGLMRAQPGDWVIKGVNGEFYPCKNDIFRKTYDQIPEPVKPQIKGLLQMYNEELFDRRNELESLPQADVDYIGNLKFKSNKRALYRLFKDNKVTLSLYPKICKAFEFEEFENAEEV